MAEFLVRMWWLAPLAALVTSIATVRTFPTAPRFRLALAAYLFSITLLPLGFWAITDFALESGETLMVTLASASLLGFFHRELLTAVRGAISQPKVGVWVIGLTAFVFVWFLAPVLAITALVYVSAAWVAYKILKPAKKKN